MIKRYSIGIDFGTNSVRALVLDLENGDEISSALDNFKSGKNGILLDEKDPQVARQSPQDYLDSMETAVSKAVATANAKGVSSESIVGIGVDATGSTPIPVDKNLIPISFKEEFKNNLNAQAWLWKDHTATKESDEITKLAAEYHPEYLAKCGGTYSSEWFFSKIYHCYNVDKNVFDAAYTWLECSDYIPAVLAGINNISDIKINACAAGHKAMYSTEWDGLPEKEFLNKLAPEIGDLRSRLFNVVHSLDSKAGLLTEEWAERFGLIAGTPIAVGALDAHMGAVGSNVGEGTLVKVIGTSTCDLMVSPEDKKLEDVPGVAGIAAGSVLPGFVGIEAGQSAVGDIFNWFVSNVLNKGAEYHEVLTAKAERLKAGESGLLALDWNNGNRNILADYNLTGLILGQTLHTKDFEIYRALIEATAFGALKIIEQLESYGIKIDKLVNCGGIAEKNPLVMQIYANVLNRPMEIAKSSQTVALGAAIMGGIASLKGEDGFSNVSEIQNRVCEVKDRVFTPQENEVTTYEELYENYKKVHDAFGLKSTGDNLYSVMKDIIKIKEAVRNYS